MSDSSPSPQMGPTPIPRLLKTADQIGWMRWLPALYTLRRYEATWLRHDMVAGLVLTTMPKLFGFSIECGEPARGRFKPQPDWLSKDKDAQMFSKSACDFQGVEARVK